MRIVRTPTGGIEIDRTGRTAGRGAYVCHAAECIDTAIKKGALTRALSIPLPPDLRATLTDGLAEPLTSTEGGARGQE